jgi:hypothetical protein
VAPFTNNTPYVILAVHCIRANKNKSNKEKAELKKAQSVLRLPKEAQSVKFK